MKKSLVFISMALSLLFSGHLFAFDHDFTRLKIPKHDSTGEKAFFELSFGQSMLFIANSKSVNVRNNHAIVIPTSAMLFFAEFRPFKRFRIPVFFDLPTETKQFLVAGQLVNERASPTFGSGVECRIFKAKIDNKSFVDFEAGPLASFLMDVNSVIRFAPIAAARLRLIRNHNFVMYMGTSYSFGINSWGLLYGTGTVF
ncbi:MAG TPA: hypothetical protein VFJ43_16485 [Bacteroidia bacterium]|nr:hypothetical protein [Bacteroidia bacterium]